MSVTLDISADFELVDNLETVTLYKRTGEGTFATPATTVENCLRREVTKDLVDVAGARLAHVETVWHIWAANLPGYVPKAKDVIQDAAGTRWVIQSVGLQSFGTRYRLPCVKER